MSEIKAMRKIRLTQTQDFHLPGIVKKNGQFEINNQIQFRILSEKEGKKKNWFGEEDLENLNMLPDEYWCLPFSADDLEDF